MVLPEGAPIRLAVLAKVKDIAEGAPIILEVLAIYIGNPSIDSIRSSVSSKTCILP